MMKRVVGISLVLENSETICLKNSEIESMCIGDITQSIVLLNKEMYELDATNRVTLQLSASANHTYNSFGAQSEQTIFDRLTEVDDPISIVMPQYEDGTYRELFIPADVEQMFAINNYGDLTIKCERPVEIDLGNDMEDEEELDC